MSDEPPTVLVVDDEPDLADLYADWLEADYEVLTAYGGREALDLLDEGVDVALLDRLMPEVSGDEVLEAIRSRDDECRVAMITAVEPDFDILEMGFDEYIVKPVGRDDLRSVVESLRSRATYDEQVQRFYALASKRAALETGKPPHELEESEAYASLTDQLDALRSDLDRTTDRMSPRDFEIQLRQIDVDDGV